MSNKTVRTYAMAALSDLTTTSNTATQSTIYKLGDRVIIYDDSQKVANEYIYVYSNGGCAQYGVYGTVYTGTSGTEVEALAPASSSVYMLHGVAPVAITSTYYGWLQIRGICTYLATSSTATAGYFGKAINGANTATDESATRGTNSILVCTATATGTSTTGYLLGERNLVA